jgi:hypothetical protein
VLVVGMESAPEHAREATRTLETCIARVASPSAYVWDEETRLMYALAAYRAGPVADWDDGVPSFDAQVTVHAMPDETTPRFRAVSLGMHRFARSDLTVPRFAEQHFERIGLVIAAVGQAMIDGPEPEGTVHVTAAALRGGEDPGDVGGEADVDVALAPAPIEEGDAENRLLELVFPGDPSTDVVDREAAFLRAAFGEDRVIGALDPDAHLTELATAARAELAARRDWFLAGVPTAQHLRIAARLTDASTEVLWVEVEAWPDATHLSGHLRSEPEHAPGLHSGDTVTITLANVEDYEITAPEGRIAGGAAYDYALTLER